MMVDMMVVQRVGKKAVKLVECLVDESVVQWAAATAVQLDAKTAVRMVDAKVAY